MKAFERDRNDMAALAARIAANGIADERILDAFREIPRRMFLSAPYQSGAYGDTAVPIECGQIIAAPSTMAAMLVALDVRPEHKVLEVGCGSGFQAAILARLVRQVVTLDRFRTLIELAEDRFAAMKIGNVVAMVADGLEGFTRHAPYDRILVDGAVAKVPGALMDQLSDRGILVAPVGTGPQQTVVRIVRDGRLFHRTEIGPARFGPLIEGVASRL